MAFVVASAPHHDAPSQRSLVVDYAPFAGDAHANVAVNAARAARVRLVSAVYEALLPFNGRRVCVCVPEAADKSALFDAVLRIAMESETSEQARRARLVIATLGAEPAHLLLAGNCPTLGDEAREAHQFLPRCSVLVEEAKRLFAVPSVRATTFEDCCAYLPRDGDLRADAAECSREAVFRDWALLGPGQLDNVPPAIIKRRCKTLLERRASLGLALLAGIRACCRGGAATPTTTQDMDAVDIAAGRQFPLLPFKAARVRLTEEGALTDAFGVFDGKDVDTEIFGAEGCVVVGATTHRAGKKLAAEVVQGRFNVLLIDEASQMLPSVAALAIKALDPECGRLVILGDPKQMRPTIRTQLPEETDVGASILDLAVRQLRGSPCLGRLDENHRMCPQLCDFTETALGYPGYCICSKGGCTCRPAVPLPPRSFTGADATLLDEASPLVVVELAGDGVPLADLRAAEAARCADLVGAYDAGAFVVTPHHAQRLAVSAALGPLAARCTIDTVERMQGRERDLVIVCFAGLDLYGDDDGVELDFVYDACRIVVALTRAKRKCVVLATERLFDPSMHRKMVAGEQIDIIRNNPPPVSEATHMHALPGNQQIIRSVQVPRKEEIRKYLRERPDTLLAFVHDEVANRGTNQQFYKFLRGQLEHRDLRATVADLVSMAQKMTPADKTTFGLNEYSFDQPSKTTGQLISWISFTQGNMGPSVKIVHGESELTWDEFDRVRTGGNGQNAPEPAAAAPGGAPTNTQMAPLSPGQQNTQDTPYNFLKQNKDTMLVFVREGVTVHENCEGYYLWLLGESGEGRQLTMREIIDRTSKLPENGHIRQLLREKNPPAGDSPSRILSCIGRWLQSSTIHFKIRVNGSDYTWRELLPQLLRARDRSPAADERPAQRQRIE